MKGNKGLVLESLRNAMEVRKIARIDLQNPICIYDVAYSMGIDVLFANLASVEGMYCKGSPSYIVLSAVRPPGRQVYTCAHELGHHVFDHGTTLDDLTTGSVDTTKEFLADCFAGFLLMPKTAVSHAFAIHGWSASTCTPIQAYIVAKWFGVGYSTLLRHMSSTLRLLPGDQAQEMRRIQPKRLRQDIMGCEVWHDLIIVDPHWCNRTIDIEVDDLIQLPPSVVCDEPSDTLKVKFLEQSLERTLIQGMAPGQCWIRHSNSDWATRVRISRRGFVGRIMYRYLEELADGK